jgi:hypothetical protein
VRKFCGLALRVLLIWAAHSVMAAATPEYCAYEIRVRSPEGKPLAGVIAGIAQKEHSIIELRTDQTGTARICDAPQTRVDVIAGMDWCGLVVVKKVRPDWLHTRTINIIYAPEDCGGFTYSPTECHMLVSLQNQRGEPVSGVKFEGSGPVRGSGPMISDSFGRIFVVLPDKRTLKGRFNRIGFGSAEVSHRCAVFNDNSPEVRLTLPKK